MGKAKDQKRATLNLWPETARLLGIGKNAVYEAARNGQIPTIKIGGRILVLRACMERMLNGSRTNSTTRRNSDAD